MPDFFHGALPLLGNIGLRHAPEQALRAGFRDLAQILTSKPDAHAPYLLTTGSRTCEGYFSE